MITSFDIDIETPLFYFGLLNFSLYYAWASATLMIYVSRRKSFYRLLRYAYRRHATMQCLSAF